jgi:hypothetical protein
MWYTLQRASEISGLTRPQIEKLFWGVGLKHLFGSPAGGQPRQFTRGMVLLLLIIKELREMGVEWADIGSVAEALLSDVATLGGRTSLDMFVENEVDGAGERSAAFLIVYRNQERKMIARSDFEGYIGSYVKQAAGGILLLPLASLVAKVPLVERADA